MLRFNKKNTFQQEAFYKSKVGKHRAPLAKTNVSHVMCFIIITQNSAKKKWAVWILCQ